MKKSKIIFVFFVFFIFLTMLSVFSYSLQQKEPPRKGGVFRIKSFRTEFQPQLDPANSDSFPFISEQIFNGLVRLDEKYDIVPVLAEYWTISPDGKVYTFYLKKDVQFHNGKEVRAEDVKYSFERLMDKGTDSTYSRYFIDRVKGGIEFWEGQAGHVSGFRILDKYVFQIEWKMPNISGLLLLSFPFCKILSKNDCQINEKKYFESPYGTGPFEFDHWIRNSKLEIIGIRLKRNKSYFKGQPYLDAVEYSPLFTQDEFLKGEIDCAPVMSHKMLKREVNILQGGKTSLVLIGMSCHLSPLDNLKFRNALLYALDKMDILKRGYDLRFAYIPTSTIIPGLMSGFLIRGRLITKDILKSEGYLSGYKNENPGTLPTMIFFSKYPRTKLKRTVYYAIKKQLENIGLKIRIKDYKNLNVIKKYEKPYIVLIEKTIDFPDPEFLVSPLVHSKGEFNVFGYHDKEMDDLINKVGKEASWSLRNELFQKIENKVSKDFPVIPLFYKRRRVAVQSNINQIIMHPLGFDYIQMKDVWKNK